LVRLLLLAAPVAVVAGCGGGSDAPITPVDAQTNAAPTISKRVFIERGDAICAEANAAIANLSAGGTTDAQTLLSQERAITEGMIGSLRSLGTPAQTQGVLNRFYNALNNQVTILERQQTALERDDAPALSTLTIELSTARSDALLAAQEYGFTRCGQAGTTLTPTPTDGVPAPAPAPAPAPDSGGTGSGGGGGGGGGGGSGGVSPN
jgi:hypothetical protein